MKPLWIVAALALAACGNQSTGGPAQAADGGAAKPPMAPTSENPGQGRQIAPETGHPGAVGTVDGGLAPPSTAMPGARPLYPDAGAPHGGGGATR